MKVWITKYALTKGILFFGDAKWIEHIPNMVCVGRNETYHGNDWHETEAAAQARAREMLLRKLKSVDAQQKRLRGLLEKPALRVVVGIS